MIGKRILGWLRIKAIHRLHLHEVLHDDRVHQAANDVTPIYAQALRNIQKAGAQARQITDEREARSTTSELTNERERMRATLGNILDRVGGR